MYQRGNAARWRSLRTVGRLASMRSAIKARYSPSSNRTRDLLYSGTLDASAFSFGIIEPTVKSDSCAKVYSINPCNSCFVKKFLLTNICAGFFMDVHNHSLPGAVARLLRRALREALSLDDL